MKELKEYDGHKNYIRHLKTPDRSRKNDCVIRALSEITGLSYYLVCKKFNVPYIANNNQHSVPKTFKGITDGEIMHVFSSRIEHVVQFANNIHSYFFVKDDINNGRLPTIERFAQTYSRRKILKDKKLLVIAANTSNEFHAVYCKNGYFYDNDFTGTDFFVTHFFIFK